MASWRAECVARGATVLWENFVGAGPWTDSVAGLVLTGHGAPVSEAGAFPGKNCLRFPTVSDYADSPDNNKLDLTSGTIVVVARRDSDLGTTQVLFSKGDGGHVFDWASDDKLEVGKAGFGPLTRDSGTTVAPSAWICWGASTTGVAAGVKQYRNGVDVTTDPGYGHTLVATAVALFVGRYHDGTLPSGGSIAGIVYFPSILTAADHLALSNAVTSAEGGIVVTAIQSQGAVGTPNVVGPRLIQPLAIGPVAPTGLPIGGLESLRGPQPYAAIPASPGGTIAAPYGAAEGIAARNAAGPGGVVRFLQAGSPYNWGMDFIHAGQTWQMETPSTVILGTIGVKAADCTFQGGETRQIVGDGLSAAAPRFKLLDVFIQQIPLSAQAIAGWNYGQGLGNWLIARVRFLDNGPTSTTTTNYRNFMTLQTSVGTVSDGLRFDDCIIDRAAGHGGDTISHTAGDSQYRPIKNFIVNNCRFDGGLGNVNSTDPQYNKADGYFGIEVWWGIPGSTMRSDGLMAGSIVQYSDLKGGSDVLMSMVRSVNNWIHHNNFKTNYRGPGLGPFAVYESAGPENTGLLMENNRMINDTKNGGVLYHNSGSHDHLIRQNEFAHFDNLLGAGSDGGGYIIIDNCVVDFNNIINPTATYAITNTQARNDASSGPCAPQPPVDSGVGTPKLGKFPNFFPPAIASGEACGNPNLTPGGVSIAESSIASAEAMGTPAIVFSQTIISVAAINTAEVVGTPGILRPAAPSTGSVVVYSEAGESYSKTGEVYNRIDRELKGAQNA